MKKLFPMTIFALAATALFATGAEAQINYGVCNSIVANGMRGAQVCENMSCMPGDAACTDVTDAFVDFLMTPGCLAAFAAGELNGLPGNASVQPGGPDAGGVKHIQEVICGAVEDCGLCAAALSAGICLLPCTD
jgi:hypothetical protein